MAEVNKTTATSPQVVEPATDRVQMLSVAKDGTPDQAPNFVFIGDKEAALAATKQQFAQQAVARVDEEKRPELGLGGGTVEVVEDKSIAELRSAQEKAVAEAEKKAAAVVNANHGG